MTDRYDPYDNAIKGYELGLKAWREICIRRGQIKPDPLDRDEVRWAREGDRKPSELDTVQDKSCTYVTETGETFSGPRPRLIKEK